MTAYSSDFYAGHLGGSLQSARWILSELFDVYRPQSVIDVGCGVGAWLRVARELGVDDLLGVDGDYVNRGQLQIDPALFVPLDLELQRLTEAVGPARRFDLAISMEVAEHLSPARAETFVEDLVALSDVVLFSAAIPFQGGEHHVNEQWPEFWGLLFRRAGYACADFLRPRIWALDGMAWWYAQNALVFFREASSAATIFGRYAVPRGVSLARVHPYNYLRFHSNASEESSKLHALLHEYTGVNGVERIMQGSELRHSSAFNHYPTLESPADELAIRYAYLYLLERNPENDVVIRDHLRGYCGANATIQAVAEGFKQSEEYTKKFKENCEYLFEKEIYDEKLMSYHIIQHVLPKLHDNDGMRHEEQSSAADITFIQSWGAAKYESNLAVVTRYNANFSKSNKINYQIHICNNEQQHANNAAFYKISLIKNLCDNGYRGWVFCLDGGYAVTEKEWDIRNDLLALRQKGKTMLLQSVFPSDDHRHDWWNVDVTVFAIDLSANHTRLLIDAWASYANLYSSEGGKNKLTFHDSRQCQRSFTALLKGLQDHIDIRSEIEFMQLEGNKVNVVAGLDDTLALVDEHQCSGRPTVKLEEPAGSGDLSGNEISGNESGDGKLASPKTIWTQLVDKLWHGIDPFREFPVERYASDTQGWNSHHKYLVEAIDTFAPRIVVEIGVWKGGSVLTMAQRMKNAELDGVVIAVDTWLGSSEIWSNKELFDGLRVKNGYPTLIKTFITNIIQFGLQDYVILLPLDSVNAACLLRDMDIHPDVIHIDGGHAYDVVSADLKVWWDLLRPGGILIGDDYEAWPGVHRAFDDFFGALGLAPFEYEGNKCRIVKPGGRIDLSSTEASAGSSALRKARSRSQKKAKSGKEKDQT